MCGIAGILNYSNNPEAFKPIEKMTLSLHHRGPDDTGIEKLDCIALGHTRLSIIDISQYGHQPMSDETNRYWIVFNGEIYNYKELRKILIEKYQFRSTSDTEVLLYGYINWGADVLQKIRGMFAFAIWDTVEKTLFLARDRVGEKPLVYGFWNGCFCFSSELNSLLKTGIPKKINKVAMLHYFNTRNSIPPPLTIYENIHKLEQGHYLIVTKNNVRKVKYWGLDNEPNKKMSLPEWEELFYQKLSEVVKRELVSDVPIGISLSGGVDSSSICLLAIEDRPDIQTFSFVTTKPDDIEKQRVDYLVKTANLKNKQSVFNENMNINDLTNLSCDYGEPFAHFPHIYISFLYKKIRESVKTIVTGNGGDEVLAGYAMYQELLCNYKYNLLQSTLGVLNSDKLWGDILLTNLGKQVFKISRRFFTKNFRNNISWEETISPYRHIFKNTKFKHFLNANLLMDLLYHHYHGVVYLHDIASMKFGLELRSPFLDNDLIELTAKMPVNLLVADKHDPHFNKYILKKSMERKLPKELLYAKKLGFGSGVDIYDLIKSPWRKTITESFNKKREIDLWLNKPSINNLWNELDSGNLKSGLYINAFYALFSWYDSYF